MWSTHCSEQYRVAFEAGVKRACRQRKAAGLNCRATDQMLLGLQFKTADIGERSQDAHGSPGNLRSDSVAG
jgi:hypothetical protein